MKQREVDHLVVYSDGGCKNNGRNHPEGYGSFVVFAVAPDGARTEVKRYSEPFPHRKTNNSAEYEALLQALYYLNGLKAKGFTFKIVAHVDSELVAGQINGSMKAKEPTLIQLRDKAKKLVDELGIDLHWRPREEIVPIIGH